MTAQEFERRFDEGEDITPYIDESSIRRPGLEARRVNVDFPEWIIQKLDSRDSIDSTRHDGRVTFCPEMKHDSSNGGPRHAPCVLRFSPLASVAPAVRDR